MSAGAMVAPGMSKSTCILTGGRNVADKQRQPEVSPVKCRLFFGGISAVTPIEVADWRHFGRCSSAATVLRGPSSGARQMKKVGYYCPRVSIQLPSEAVSDIRDSGTQSFKNRSSPCKASCVL